MKTAVHKRLGRYHICRRFFTHILNTTTLCLILMLPSLSYALDSDGDGIDDASDNCSEVANADQRDSDGDGFGNRCDPDLNNDGVVNPADAALFKIEFGSSGPAADFNGDGIVDPADAAIFKTYFGEAPGPGAIKNELTDAQAARFLTQATFGPTLQEIQHLKNLGSYEAWIEEQFAQPTSLLLPATKSMYQAYQIHCVATKPAGECTPSLQEILTSGADDRFDTWHQHYRYVWWMNTIDGADQLRQRVAFALSEILVVSSEPDSVTNSSLGVAHFYDTLSEHAFGNYRELLEAVTIHPVMGIYLSMVQNEKADPENNIRPDENYARELLQLFSIGVDRLNLDGTPLQDGDGKNIATYGQVEVQEFARVFTGWTFADVEWWDWWGMADRTKPMEPHEQYHDTGEKHLLNGAVLPAGQSARQDLEAALDNVFNHPNVGPFISKLLIQRLITSNPSPEYVGRIAHVFNNNGAGIRGDLRAVVKAILLDQEASDPTLGKLREPLLRVSHLFRAFHANRIDAGGWNVPPGVAVYNSPGNSGGLFNFERDSGQNILASPTVFNFFLPSYSPAGPVRDSGLVAPEFQIATENNVMAMINTINFHVLKADEEWNTYWTRLDFSHEAQLAANPDVLLDHLDALLTGGQLSDNLRQLVSDHIDSDIFPDNEEGRLAKAKDAVALILSSPEYLIQK